MKKLFFAFLVLVLGWDVIWSLLGVKPLFPWQLQQKMAQHPSDLVLLNVHTPWEFHWFHPLAPKMCLLSRDYRTNQPSPRPRLWWSSA